jgi:hypothetical protein
VTKDETQRLHEAIDALRGVLNALTDEGGNANPQVADAIGCDFARLDVYVADTRWLLNVLLRVQQRQAA